MKQIILTFMFIFILVGGLYTNTSDGVITANAELESRTNAVSVNAPQTKRFGFSRTMPNFAIFLLLAIGMVGLVGVSRKNNL